jgi:hypothetical protein
LNSGESLLSLGMSKAGGVILGFSVNRELVVGTTLVVCALKCLGILGLDACFFLALPATINTGFLGAFSSEPILLDREPESACIR